MGSFEIIAAGAPNRQFDRWMETLNRVGFEAKQSFGTYLPDGKLPETLSADSEVKDPKYYEVILVVDGKAIGSSI